MLSDALVPGPFTYAESWDEAAGSCQGLAINNAASVQVVIDKESLIVSPNSAVVYRQKPPAPTDTPVGGPPSSEIVPKPEDDDGVEDGVRPADMNPTRFIGTAMISSELPARDIHQIVEDVIEQLTTPPGSEVTPKLEIDAEVPSGLDRAKLPTLNENANTLGFIEKTIKW